MILRIFLAALCLALALPAGAQTVTNAPAWTPVIPVRAACNGVDDTAAFQAAAAAVPAAGATLSLPSGTCIIAANIALVSNTRVVGQGRQATIVKLKNNTNGVAIFTNATTPGNNIEIRDMTIDGNAANNGGNGVQLISFTQVSNARLDNLELSNVACCIGVFISGNGVPATTGDIITNIWSHDVTGMALQISFGQRQTILKGWHSQRDGSPGIAPMSAIYLDVSEDMVDGMIVDASKGNGIYIHNVFGGTYANLVATRSAFHGIQVAEMVSTQGNNWRAQNNGTATPATYDDIHFLNISGDSYGITLNSQVTGMQVGPEPLFGAAGQQRNGLYVEDNITGNVRLVNVQCGPLSSAACIRQPAAPGALVVAEFKTVANTLSNLPQVANATVYASTADAVTNTTGDLTCFGTGTGSQTIPANSVTVGTRFVLDCAGVMTTPGSNAATLAYKIKWGATTVVSNTTIAIPSPATAFFIDLHGYCTVRSIGASGSMICSAKLSTYNTAAAGIYAASANAASPVTIDTTAGSKLDMTAAWSTVAGGQTATFQQSTLQVIN